MVRVVADSVAWAASLRDRYARAAYSPGVGLSSGLGRVLGSIDRRPETPVVVCIDVEPDPRVFDRADPPAWTGFERFLQRLPDLRERLSRASGKPVTFTWFLRMDPQVAEAHGSPTWVAQSYGEQLAQLIRSGDELGVHTHFWRWDSRSAEWIADFVDAEWMDYCVTMSLDAFEAALGRHCSAHRGGDRFLSGTVLLVLDRRGVEIDLTVEPGQPPVGAKLPTGETARGTLPDYRRVPVAPYRSSPETFPAPDPSGGSGPLLIPLLSAPRRRPPFRREPLTVWDGSAPGAFRVRLAVELLRSAPPVLAIAVRSDTGCYDWAWDQLTGRLEDLAKHPRMVFMTASAAAHHLAARTAASRIP
jgi:hypothetical protein